MAKVSKDTPLSELTLRKYEPPRGASFIELIRKTVLSLGLLQPGDSRDVIVDVLAVLVRSKHAMTSKEIEHAVIDSRSARGAVMLGVAPSNIRRQVLRLRDVFLIEKVQNTYRVREGMPLLSLFEEHLEQYVIAHIVSRIKEYLSAIDSYSE